jgi:hypothetical protein
MDINHVDTLLQSLKSAISRRGLLAGLSGGLLATRSAAHGGDEAAARKRRKRRKKRKRSDKKRAVTRADASCPGPSAGIIPIASSGEFRFAQTFTAGRSGELVRAEIEILRNTATAGDFILRLAPLDSEGVPTNTVLAESSVRGAEAPEDPATVSFSFADPASVEAGITYALVLTRPGGDRFGWAVEAAAGCPGERFRSVDQSAPFETQGSGLGFVFTTFVRS